MIEAPKEDIRPVCPICGYCPDYDGGTKAEHWRENAFTCKSCERDNICSRHKTDRNVCDQCDPEYQIRE